MKYPVALILLTAFFSACSFMEPSAASRFHASPGTTAEAVFVCAESTIRVLRKQQGGWSDLVTTRDHGNGLFETNRFEEVNIIGVRTQIRYEPETGAGRIKIKASGPYFSDMGAERAAAQLASGIAQCL